METLVFVELLQDWLYPVPKSDVLGVLEKK